MNTNLKYRSYEINRKFYKRSVNYKTWTCCAHWPLKHTIDQKLESTRDKIIKFKVDGDANWLTL